MTVERDVLDRLEALGIRYFITGSWASGFYAEPRMTRDIDLALDMGPTDYERLIRPAFEADFVVNDPVDLGGRWIGGLIHKIEIDRVDLMFARDDPWARSAMGRRRRITHAVLGDVWMISQEDLVIAKLEWSEGTSELQLRDVRSIVRLAEDLDWSYLEGHAARMGMSDRLESVRGG